MVPVTMLLLNHWTPHCHIVSQCAVVLFQGRAEFFPAGDRSLVRAVFPEVLGKRPSGPGAGGREAGPQTVSERKPGAQCPQPGTHTVISNSLNSV